MSQFLTQLKDNVLVADGAIGTILYSGRVRHLSRSI